MTQEGLTSHQSVRFRLYRTLKPLKTVSVALALYVLLSTIGCTKNLGVPDAQLMGKELPQCFVLKSSAEEVWLCICKRQKAKPSCTILAKSPEDYVISWCERDSAWRDLGQDSVGPDPRALMTNPNRYQKYAQAPRKGQVLTTIRIEDLGSGCRLHIRRVYHATKSFATLGHSRGDFERKFIQQLKAYLGES